MAHAKSVTPHQERAGGTADATSLTAIPLNRTPKLQPQQWFALHHKSPGIWRIRREGCYGGNSGF